MADSNLEVDLSRSSANASQAKPQDSIIRINKLKLRCELEVYNDRRDILIEETSSN